MFIAAQFTKAKTWEQLKCPSTDEQIKKTWYKHTVECYSAFYLKKGNSGKKKKKEILHYTTTWMNLEYIVLSLVRQIQKDKLPDSTL